MQPKNYPEFQNLKVPAHTSPATHLASPPLSPNATRGHSPVSPAKPNVLKKNIPGSPDGLRVKSPEQRPKPALRNKDKGSKKKKVHWTPSVIDNEGKPPPQPRANATLTITKPKMPSSPLPRITSKQVPSASRMPANMILKSQSANTAAKRDHRLPGIAAQFPAKRPQSSRTEHGRAPERPAHMRRSVAPEGPRSSPSKSQPTTRKAVVPPHVPDAPPRRRQAPPTPRPARLPTPDLPEISDRPFCECMNAYCNGDHRYYDQGRPVHVKMENQLEAAMAYMKYLKRQ